MNAIHLSEELLYKVKLQGQTILLTSQIEHLNLTNLDEELGKDLEKKAFWINIYNAYFQILRTEGIIKPSIYRKKLIRLAGLKLSLDDIEHGILRKYRLKWALGYLSNPFVSSTIKELAVSKVDYRIHFALNCGAKSCPPIAFYSPDKIDQQLDLATLSFLESEIDIFPEKNEIHISRIFQWFVGDFGGAKGIKQMLKEKLGIETGNMKLRFKDYDYEEELNNFNKSNTN